jgi:hypothetical protein
MRNLGKLAVVAGFASAIGALLVLMTSGAGASTITITNPSFELPVAPVSPGYTTVGAPANWSGNSFTGVYIPNDFGDGPAPDGNQAAFVNPGNNISTVGASPANALSSSTLAAGTYTLTVYVDNRGASDGATIDLLAGGNIVGTLTTTPPSLDTWEQVTLTVVISGTNAYLGDALGIELAANSASNGASVDFDDVNLSFATPLPATLPLFAGGLGFVGYLTKRRKQNAKQALAAA